MSGKQEIERPYQVHQPTNNKRDSATIDEDRNQVRKDGTGIIQTHTLIYDRGCNGLGYQRAIGIHEDNRYQLSKHAVQALVVLPIVRSCSSFCPSASASIIKASIPFPENNID